MLDMIGDKVIIDGEEWEEINGRDWMKYNGAWAKICKGGNVKYYIRVKKSETFPKIFEDDHRKIEVWRDGWIKLIRNNNFNDISIWDDSLEILYEAVAESQRLRGLKNE